MKDELQAGIEVDGVLHSLGNVSMAPGGSEVQHLVSIMPVALQDLLTIKVTGVLGANFAQTNYYYMVDNKPRHLLTVEGHALEKDLDSDGDKEIITSTGTIPTTCIYKNLWERNKES